MKAKDKNTSGLSAFGALGLGMELGINVALPLILGVWIGSWLDRLLGTGGVIMVVTCVVALLVGAYNFYGVVARELKWK